mgnify:CR=1 FL=1
MQPIDSPNPLALYRAEAGDLGGLEVSCVEGQTLVLGHALGADRHMWDEVLALLPNNLDVILWEQPGHGNSRLLQESKPSVNTTADVLAAALAELQVGQAHLAGLSLGGMTALAFAERHPGMLKSVSIMDAGPVLEPAEAWRQKATQVREEGLEPLVDGTMERWFTPDFLDTPEVTRTRETFLTTSPEGYAQCCEIIANTDLRGELGEVDVPALVLTGEGDAGMTPMQAAALGAELPQAQDPVVVPDARHLTAVESPARVAEALVEMVCANS